MADLKIEQKIKDMAKSGEFKEKLLSDHEFIAKIKEILKKEGIAADNALITRMISETQDLHQWQKRSSR